MKRALLSVSDKTDVVPLAQGLVKLGFGLLSTGGTFALLQQHGIAATEVADYTGFAEMMAGRVKTLHPKIHGGILGRRGVDDEVMANHSIDPIDVVVVNLYPFAEVTKDPNVDLAIATENIDIGGPAMVRSAAKNHAHVAIITDPRDYQTVLDELTQNGNISDDTRFDLAVKAFEHTAHYDGLIASFLGKKIAQSPYPRTFNWQLSKAYDLRYGENPHQSAAFYCEPFAPTGCVATATVWQGKQLSYNNIADTDAALECVKNFDKPACVIVKHANPCGVATACDILSAYELAYATDPESAFGGIIAFNRPLDTKTAQAIIDKQFVEVIIAPSLAAGVLDITASKKNVRVLSCGEWTTPSEQLDLKRVTGGLLVQSQDSAMVNPDSLSIAGDIAPDQKTLDDLMFAWIVAKYVKSNAIVYAKNGQTIGIGAGQMSRVNSARIAAIKAEQAGLDVTGAVMASDAFFPFRDGIDNAAQVGIKAIIQPGGSVRDSEVIAAANEHGIAMVFSHMRHFRH